jgi:hypothetical protein
MPTLAEILRLILNVSDVTVEVRLRAAREREGFRQIRKEVSFGELYSLAVAQQCVSQEARDYVTAHWIEEAFRIYASQLQRLERKLREHNVKPLEVIKEIKLVANRMIVNHSSPLKASERATVKRVSEVSYELDAAS